MECASEERQVNIEKDILHMKHIEHGNKHHKVRIHINREPYHSPTPTTGVALYELDGISEHHDLFREICGDREDELIERHAHDVPIHEDEHFYSQRVFTVIVNAEAKEVEKNRLTYEDVVKLADFEVPPPGSNILITVDYGMGPAENPQGSLRQGQAVRLKTRMVFDVTATDRS